MTTARTAPKRPSLAKKQNRQEKDKQDALIDNGVKLTIGGEEVEVKAGDLNALHARELRRQVGVTFPGLVAVLGSSYFDIDMVAALLWLRRLIDGEDVTYDEVAEETGYDVLDDFGAEADDEVVDPEG